MPTSALKAWVDFVRRIGVLALSPFFFSMLTVSHVNAQVGGTRVFNIDPGLGQSSNPTASASGLFSTGLTGANVADRISSGPLTLVMGVPDTSGMAPLSLQDEVTFSVDVTADKSCVCLKLLTDGQSGSVSCNGGGNFDTQATRAANAPGTGWTATGNLPSTNAPPGSATLLVMADFENVTDTSGQPGFPCDHVNCATHVYTSPPNVFAFTTTTATAIQQTTGAPITLPGSPVDVPKYTGQPFDCANFAMPGSGGRLVAPAPASIVILTANLFRFAEGSSQPSPTPAGTSIATPTLMVTPTPMMATPTVTPSILAPTSTPTGSVATGCDPSTEVSYSGHCYYLDGSQGVCDPGYVLADESILTTIAPQFVGKTYRHLVSQNCCIYNAGPFEDWGMASHCNVPGPFTAGDPQLGAIGCTHATNLFPGQLTLCAKNNNCGNGVVDQGEQCDDGNLVSGDGCNGQCEVEPCYTCSGSPSACTSVPDGSACDDGLFCNGTDQCLAGSCAVHSGDPCVGGLECDNVCNEAANNCALPAGTGCTADAIPCTVDECDGMGSCIHPVAFNFTACDDGDFCNGPDECFAGVCQIHSGDPCVFDECSPICDETAQACDPAAAGTPCTDDGLPCTSDQCDGIGFCSHPPTAGGTPCPDDGNVCTIDECNGIGLCIHPPAPDGTTCDDLNACTQTDQCQSGHCVGANPVICTAPTCYEPGTCEPSTGTCTNCPAGYTPGNGGCEKQYTIDASLLDNLPFSCGPTRYECNSSFGFGFHWTDTADDAVGDVMRVDMEWQPGEDCFLPQHFVALNDVQIGMYATTSSATCSCFPSGAPAVLANVDPAAYVKGGDNTVAITTTSCAGLGPDADGHYAVATVTYADPGLAADLRAGCRTAAKSHFGYKNNANDALDRLLWSWGKGAATSTTDFGDPTASTPYRLCVFRETASKPALLFSADVPPGATAWRSAHAGFTYDDSAGGHDGIHTVQLRGGGAGRARLSVSGQGANLSDPALPLPLDTAGIRVQLTDESNDTCWESEFPLNRITADDKRIKATVH